VKIKGVWIIIYKQRIDIDTAGCRIKDPVRIVEDVIADRAAAARQIETGGRGATTIKNIVLDGRRHGCVDRPGITVV